MTPAIERALSYSNGFQVKGVYTSTDRHTCKVTKDKNRAHKVIRASFLPLSMEP